MRSARRVPLRYAGVFSTPYEAACWAALSQRTSMSHAAATAMEGGDGGAPVRRSDPGAERATPAGTLPHR